jgi:hypothetical protein
MAAQIENISGTVNSKAVFEKVKASLLNNIQQTVGIPTFPSTSTLDKNIVHLYDGRYEADTLVKRVVSALAQSDSINVTMDGNTIDSFVNSVWNNLFQQPL